MTNSKVYIYQTSDYRKFVYKCPHCRKGIMKVNEIKVTRTEQNLLNWDFTCDNCKKLMTNLKFNGKSFKQEFPPLEEISEEDYKSIEEKVGFKNIYLFTET